MNRRLRFLFLSVGALLLLWPGQAISQEIERVEVVQVEGLIDGSVERTVLAVIEEAERRDEPTLVVLQIDSAGVVGKGRALRMYEAIGRSEVTVVPWVGPAGARAAHGALLVLEAGNRLAAAPGAILGPVETIDFKERVDFEELNRELSRLAEGGLTLVFEDRPAVRITSTEDYPRIVLASSLEELVEEEALRMEGEPGQIWVAEDARVRFHNLDLFGRVLHAAAQPSMAYLLLLAGLVGIVFEVFHPSTGPAGVAGLAGLALGLYGIAALGGSWLGFALIVLGVAAFCVDLRFLSLGPLTASGFAGLVAGSLLLFRGPWLRVSPWILAFGITAMVLFLVGAMTRVLRDLRAVARGELEVRDAHPHPNGQEGR